MKHAHPSSMDIPDHVKEASERQAAIIRAMTPQQRLKQALAMNRGMRSLMDAGIRAQHPHWSEQERTAEIARRIRNAGAAAG